MAYSTSNPPVLVAQLFGGYKRKFQYMSSDAASTVRVAGYFTDALKRGMQVGDLVEVYNQAYGSTALSGPVTMHTVIAVTSTGADLSDATTEASTANTD